MTDKKPTDNEIIKALEEWLNKICDSYQTSLYFGEVAISTDTEAYMCLLRETLDLINRQQKIIEKSEKVEHFADKTIAALQAENEELKQIAEYQQDVSMKRYFEIKRLKEDRSGYGMDKHDAAELAYKNGQK